MTAPVIDVLHYEAAPVNPTAFGLYAATDWVPDENNRFLNGVEVRGPNYGGDNASGVWAGHYCSAPIPGQIKEGTRPEILDPFDPITVWAYDECDLTEPSRREIEARAAQILRLEEQTAVELEFSARLLVDAGELDAVPGLVARPNLKAAVAYLEGEQAKTETVGWFHIGAHLVALEEALFKRSGSRWVSPLGNIWVIGGGYVEGLEDTIVATSQPFGWRDTPTTRTAIDERHNVYAAVAERSVAIGYEAVIAAVQITP